MSILFQKYGLTSATTSTGNPEIEPVTVAQVRQYTRISDPDDDAWIKGAIMAARLMVEKHTHRQLITKTWNLTLDEFPNATASIPLPRPPLQAVNEISYVASDGSTTTIDSTSLHTDTASEPGRVAPVFNWYWPSARAQNASVTIQYTAGYGDEAANVPQPLRQAILSLVGHWYENREAVSIGGMSAPVAMTFDALCSSYRFGGLH